MIFQYPLVLLAILGLPLLYYFPKVRENLLPYSYSGFFSKVPVTFKAKYQNTILKGLRIFALLLLIIALARPKKPLENTWQETEGVDIVLVVDVSSSMLAVDFSEGQRKISRLDVVKQVISDFIKEREQDRIGIVIFAGEPMTLCPLTTDYGVLDEFLQMARIGILPDNTAIGDALAFGVKRLNKSQSKSRIMILLTDGANNAGKIDPNLAAEIASTYKIKVYTIGAGKDGPVLYPVENPFFGTEYRNVNIPIDETILKAIASKTNGKYFRATTAKGLEKIYDEINEMEKTKVKTARLVDYKELFYLFLIPALFVILLEIILRNTIFLKVP